MTFYTVYFGFGFVYCYLAVGIALWKNNAVFITAVPLVFFHAECIFAAGIGNILPFDIETCVMPFQGYYSPIEQMVPLLGVAGLGALIVELRLRCKKSWVTG